MNRLISAEWLKLRKRPMPWVLLIAVLALTIIVFMLTYVAAQFGARSGGAQAGGLLLPSLQIPGAFYNVINTGTGLAELAVSVVAAIMAGTEFSLGTVRQLLVRGPGRIRIWGSKMLLLLIFSLIISLILALLGLILGTLIDALTHHTSAWSLGETLFGVLRLVAASTLSMWAYGLLGLLAATFFRSPIAGIGVALGFRVAELILNPLLILALRGDGLLNFIGQLNYFLLGNNADGLMHYAAPTGWTSVPSLFIISGPQALTYMLILPALCLGLTLLNIQRRDVTS